MGGPRTKGEGQRWIDKRGHRPAKATQTAAGFTTVGVSRRSWQARGRQLERTRALGVVSLALTTALPGAGAAGASPTPTSRAGTGLLPGPAGGDSHSDQTWSGYAVTSSGPYKSITGSWNIPTMNCSKGRGDASPWIGIDGWSNDTVEKIGIALDCEGGR